MKPQEKAGELILRSYKLPLYLTLIAFAISANTVPPLLSTLSLELALPAWTLGAGITLQYISFFAISWLGGIIGDRHRIPRRVMILSGLFILTPALALAPSIISSLSTILLWMCILGLAGGLVETFASISLMENSPSDSSKTLCLSQAFYALGAFIAPQAASSFLERSGGWKSTFTFFGALAAATTIFFIAFGRGIAPPSDPSGAMAISGKRDTRLTVQGHSAFSFRLLIFAYVTVEALCGSWMPFILESRRGFSAEKAASTASFFWFGMIAGRVAVAFLPDRLTLRPAITASAILATGAALAVLLFPGSSLISLAIMGFAMGPIWPITVRMAAAALRSGSLTASVIATGGLGAAAGPLLGSMLLAGGLAHIYFHVVTILCLSVAAIISIALTPKRKVES
ncbi:MAG: MFS transporter [Rectinemataceae bacterium]